MRYEFDPADARKFAEIVGIHSYQKGNELTFKYCPYCNGAEKDKKTFSINMDTGVFQCFRSSCGVKGNMIRLAKGTSLRCEGTCETYDVPGYAIDDMNQYGGFTGVKTVQAAAALQEEQGELNLFVINADLKEAQEQFKNYHRFLPPFPYGVLQGK